jgi:hypothetical protein
VRLVGHDELADRLVHRHDLADRPAAPQVRCLHEHLGHDTDQLLREETLRLLAFLRGERVDHAVHGLDRARGVQRAEHQVPCLGGGHRPADGVRVAQLAHQDDVRVLAHRCPHAFGERRQVGMQLALDHLRELAAVDELDRVFEADDVELSVPVQVIDHRCERGRLARPGRAGDQHQPLVVVAELLDHRWQFQ